MITEFLVQPPSLPFLLYPVSFWGFFFQWHVFLQNSSAAHFQAWKIKLQFFMVSTTHRNLPTKLAVLENHYW